MSARRPLEAPDARAVAAYNVAARAAERFRQDALARASAAFGSGAAAEQWLTTPCAALGGVRPMELVILGETDRVYGVLTPDP